MKQYIAFIGTNSVRGSKGIYTLHINGETLEPKIAYTQDAFNTGALILSYNKKFLYAASEGMTFMGKGSGGAMAYEIENDGRLHYLGGIPTNGQRPCCISVDKDNKNLYAANFIGQSLAMIPINEDGSLSPVHNLIKEPEGLDGFMNGMHCARVMDDGKSVGAICVGSGEFILYSSDTGERKGSFRFGEHSGPRHFVTGQNDSVIYGLMQMPPEVHVVRREGSDKYVRIQIISAVLPGHKGLCGASEIRITPDGKYILAATRGNDTIAVFKIRSDGSLDNPGIVKMPGNTPRDFNISSDGKVVVTALQASDEVCVHSFDSENGILTERFSGLKIPSPAAVEIF